MLPTLPSAQSIISSRGKFALGMAVVFHHIGRPRHNTISQNDNMTVDRLLVSDGFSGGGSLRPPVMVVLLWAATGSGSWRVTSSGAVGIVLVVAEAMSTSWAGVADIDMATLATLCRGCGRSRT